MGTCHAQLALLTRERNSPACQKRITTPRGAGILGTITAGSSKVLLIPARALLLPLRCAGTGSSPRLFLAFEDEQVCEQIEHAFKRVLGLVAWRPIKADCPHTRCDFEIRVSAWVKH